MDVLKILIVEDEMVIAMDIQDQLEDLGYEVVEIVATYDEASEILAKQTIDLALLDIQIKGNKSGIDIAKFIKDKIDIPFIYLTSNSDKKTVTEAVKTSPSAYLMKPFNSEDLFTSIELAVAKFQKEHPGNKTNQKIKDSLFIKNKYLFHKVRFDEIVYVKSQHVYVEIYTSGGVKHVVRDSLTDFLERLPKQFFRTHRSYAINLDFIDAINSVDVVVNKQAVPISKTYRDSLMNLVEAI